MGGVKKINPQWSWFLDYLTRVIRRRGWIEDYIIAAIIYHPYRDKKWLPGVGKLRGIGKIRKAISPAVGVWRCEIKASPPGSMLAHSDAFVRCWSSTYIPEHISIIAVCLPTAPTLRMCLRGSVYTEIYYITKVFQNFFFFLPATAKIAYSDHV